MLMPTHKPLRELEDDVDLASGSVTVESNLQIDKAAIASAVDEAGFALAL